MTDSFDHTSLRSLLFSEILRERADIDQRRIIEQDARDFDFHPIKNLMISTEAWGHAERIAVAPKLIFAHPDILMRHPTTSLYYRGMALLSQKRVQQTTGVNVSGWEDGSRKTRIQEGHALKAARVYNAVVSSIIEGSTDWSLDNGYRNILATMGVRLDGMFRNKIGAIAETRIKGRIVEWLKDKDIIPTDTPQDEKTYQLPENTVMQYGSEPDIAFYRGGSLIATIEIKGGTDPAGALERLGAMSKSFEETPAGCVNFLVAGVITPEMQARLNSIGVIRSYLLSDLLKDGNMWDDFANEVFHHAVRVTLRGGLA